MNDLTEKFFRNEFINCLKEKIEDRFNGVYTYINIHVIIVGEEFRVSLEKCFNNEYTINVKMFSDTIESGIDVAMEISKKSSIDVDVIYIFRFFEDNALCDENKLKVILY